MKKLKAHKSVFKKFLIFVFALALALPVVNPSSTYAESSEYFNVDGYDISYYDGVDSSEDTLYATMGVTKDLRIYDFEAYVEVPDSDDAELKLYWIPRYPGLYNYFSADTTTGQVKWIGDDYLELYEGSGLFSANYRLKDGITDLDRQVSITIVSATVSDDEGETYQTIENLTLKADFSVTTYSEYYSVDVDVEGYGYTNHPDYVISGEVFEVEIESYSFSEILYVLVNYEDATDQVVDGVLTLTADKDNFYIQVFFQPVYDVTDGDGGEHVIGDGESLEFVIDADLTDFNGTGVVQVDEDYLLVDEEWVADDYYSTITLASDYLDTLEAGTHSLTLYFPGPEKGVARATFSVIDPEESEEESEDSDSSEESSAVVVPDTGAYTATGTSASALSSTVMVSSFVAVIVVLASWFTLKKHLIK